MPEVPGDRQIFDKGERCPDPMASEFVKGIRDCFAVLEQPRHPWLDPAELKARFLQLAAEAHPDRVHQAGESATNQATDRYQELNAAFQCLREPKDRLFHLLELEHGQKPSGLEQVPAESLELFMEVGRVCRSVDRFLAGRSRVSSPVVKAQWFQTGLEWTDRLQTLLGRLREQFLTLEARLKELNSAWDSAPAVGDPKRAGALPLPELEQISRDCSYLTRWTAQLQERVVQLST